MSPIFPALAVAAVGPAAVLVARRRSQVLHIARPARRTGTGGVPRDTRPLCGRRARTWPLAAVDGRRLCTGCARAAARTADITAPTLPALVPVEQLEQTIVTAPDLRTLESLVLIVARSPRCAHLARLVAETRGRLKYESRRQAAAAEWARVTGQAS